MKLVGQTNKRFLSNMCPNTTRWCYRPDDVRPMLVEILAVETGDEEEGSCDSTEGTKHRCVEKKNKNK